MDDSNLCCLNSSVFYLFKMSLLISPNLRSELRQVELAVRQNNVNALVYKKKVCDTMKLCVGTGDLCLRAERQTAMNNTKILSRISVFYLNC